MAALAADAADMNWADINWVRRIAALAEARAAERRRAVAAAAQAAGVDEARVEGDAVRLTGPGLKRRWMADLMLRQAGRDGL